MSTSVLGRIFPMLANLNARTPQRLDDCEVVTVLKVVKMRASAGEFLPKKTVGVDALFVIKRPDGAGGYVDEHVWALTTNRGKKWTTYSRGGR